jgi:hypothetical protein
MNEPLEEEVMGYLCDLHALIMIIYEEPVAVIARRNDAPANKSSIEWSPLCPCRKWTQIESDDLANTNVRVWARERSFPRRRQVD